MTDERSVRIEDKLDKVASEITEIKVTLGKQHESLVYHIHRTDLLESQIEPLKKHANMVNGALKLIGLLGVIAAIFESAAVFLEFIRK